MKRLVVGGVLLLILIGALTNGSKHSTQSSTATTPLSPPAAAPSPRPSQRPAGAPVTHCDQNIAVGPHTSCGFANNVFEAYAQVLTSGATSAPESVAATSPSTGKTYSLNCSVAGGGIVTCNTASGAEVTFPHWAARVYNQPAPPSPSPPPSGEPPPSEPPSSSSGEEDEVGSSSHATDAQFCSQHECIGSFETEGGTIVECSDGSYSHAGGISGACSHHGGEANKE
jgi:hypothetical protein